MFFIAEGKFAPTVMTFDLEDSALAVSVKNITLISIVNKKIME
jgi:hypothetical protein